MPYLLLAVKHCRGSNRLRIYASVHYPNQKHCLLHSAGGGLILHRQDLKTTTTTSQTGSFRVHACSHSQCHHNEAVPVLCPLYCTYRCAELMTQRIWFYLQRLFVVVSVVVVGGGSYSGAAPYVGIRFSENSSVHWLVDQSKTVF